MTKSELVTVIAEKNGMKTKAAKAAVEAVFAAISEALVDGEKVSVPGFGNFEVKTRAEREGKNPITKEPITIPESKFVTFKASGALKDKLN